MPGAYRCTFAEAQFRKWEHAFWALPSAWGAEPPYVLADLYRSGGIGIFSILPVLGAIAHHRADSWALSLAELSRLAGVDAKTAEKATRALEAAGWAEREVRRRRGVHLTHWWGLTPLAAPRGEAGRFAPDYFFMSARVVYGGNWCRLSRVQRAVYIGAATRARTITDPPEEISYIRDDLLPGTDLSDLHECRTAEPKSPHLRLACVSQAELSAILGLGTSAISEAVRGLRAAPEFVSDDTMYTPLWAYPTRGGSLVYHFRDHVDHWPWSALNARPAKRPLTLGACP